LIDRFPELSGCVLTFDALHAVKETFEKTVVGKRADFLVCVKGNAPDLRQRLERVFSRRPARVRRARTVEKGHGRIEIREIEMAPTSPVVTRWPHTHVVCRVTRDRETVRRGETVSHSHELVYFVGSFPETSRTPEQALELTRGHWSIENCLHHRKDRSMDEDRNRASAHGIGRVMCCMRSITALVLGRSKESASEVQCRLRAKAHLVLGLLSCHSLAEWERLYRPYKPL
jgi:predicted transposase YbfD/YdcC